MGGREMEGRRVREGREGGRVEDRWRTHESCNGEERGGSEVK